MNNPPALDNSARAKARNSAFVPKRRQQVAHAWRGYGRLTAALALLATLPALILPELITVPVYNDYQPALSGGVLLIFGSLLILAALPGPPTVLFTALLSAGVLSNTLLAQLAPIADYLLVPGSGDHYFNVADLLIVSGIAVTPLLLYRLWPLWRASGH